MVSGLGGDAGVSNVAIRANEPGTLSKTQPPVVPYAVLLVDLEEQYSLVVAVCRKTAQPCFAYL